MERELRAKFGMIDYRIDEVYVDKDGYASKLFDECMEQNLNRRVEPPVTYVFVFNDEKYCVIKR